MSLICSSQVDPPLFLVPTPRPERGRWTPLWTPLFNELSIVGALDGGPGDVVGPTRGSAACTPRHSRPQRRRRRDESTTGAPEATATLDDADATTRRLTITAVQITLGTSLPRLFSNVKRMTA